MMTSTINSHAFLAKKPMTSPAVLKTKLAIAQTNPGKISPSFFPMVFNPLPTPLPRDVNPFFKLATITQMTTPTADATANTVNPFF